MIKALEVKRVVSPVSRLKRRAIFSQKEPIRRNLLAILLHIDAILRADQRLIRSCQESADSAAIKENVDIGTD